MMERVERDGLPVKKIVLIARGDIVVWCPSGEVITGTPKDWNGESLIYPSRTMPI